MKICKIFILRRIKCIELRSRPSSDAMLRFSSVWISPQPNSCPRKSLHFCQSTTSSDSHLSSQPNSPQLYPSIWQGVCLSFVWSLSLNLLPSSESCFYSFGEHGHSSLILFSFHSVLFTFSWSDVSYPFNLHRLLADLEGCETYRWK